MFRLSIGGGNRLLSDLLVCPLSHKKKWVNWYMCSALCSRVYMVQVDENAVLGLMELGWSRGAARAGLRATGCAERAHHYLAHRKATRDKAREAHRLERYFICSPYIDKFTCSIRIHLLKYPHYIWNLLSTLGINRKRMFPAILLLAKYGIEGSKYRY